MWLQMGTTDREIKDGKNNNIKKQAGN